MRTRNFDTGESIYRRGEAASSAFEVRAGTILLSWPGPSELQLTATLGVGQIFGEAEMLAGVLRSTDAEAVDEVVLIELRREDLVQLFLDDVSLAKSFLRPVFERLRREADAAEKKLRDEARHAPPAVMSKRLLLKPNTREVAQQISADGVRITSLPFRVGRRSLTVGANGAMEGPIDLALEDFKPYSLSRRHFAVERRNGGLVVRDCGSHHGTIVNGVRIGGALAESVASLNPGENRIVAGRSSSPFRFVLTVEGA